MKMVAFQIQHYRSILDSGWVDVEDFSVIVGKNESGKTSLLRALWKFNPYTDAPYDLSREWPRGHRREMHLDQPVATVRFEFTPEERATLAALHASAADITGVEIQRNYAGTYLYHFLPMNPEDTPPTTTVLDALKRVLSNSPQTMLRQLQERYAAVLTALLRPGRGDTAMTPETMSALQTMVYTVPSRKPADVADALNISVNQAVAELSAQLPARRVVELVHSWLPTFVYMDDYKIFHGSAQLDQMAQRKRERRLTDEDHTLITIMEMSGLELDDEVRKVSRPDREQRILDLNDASRTLTEEIAHRWSQKKYEVMFQADGYHFLTFVKDVDTHVLVPLEERSKGFQWFFSFDMTFMHETAGMFTNAILLLDEPGLHLHAAAQQDLLARLREYANTNQLIYTTHLPFMVDFAHTDAIRIAEDTGRDGTRVISDWSAADGDSRFTLHAAIGLALSRQLLCDQYNLIVDEVSDYWLLSTLIALYDESGFPGLDERLIITPLGGASTTAFAGLLLQRRHLNVAVLTAGAPADTHTADDLLQRWIRDDARVIALDQVLNLPYPCTLEDLFTEEFYCGQVQASYRTELGAAPLVLARAQAPILTRVTEALAARGLTRFNRSRVARHILHNLNGKTLEMLPDATLQRISRLVAAINRVVNSWDSELPATSHALPPRTPPPPPAPPAPIADEDTGLFVSDSALLHIPDKMG